MIDLCSSSSDEACNVSSDDGDECSTSLSEFSPVKPKTAHIFQDSDSSNCNPKDIIKSIIPDVHENDYHDDAKSLPVLSRTLEGLSVLQLFTLMIGAMPADRMSQKAYYHHL